MIQSEDKRPWLQRPLFPALPALTGERFILILIILLAAFSRLYKLGERVMSHDESVHVYFSWLFEQGQGYSHTPSTHGPLQFHLIALTYLLFGDSDFTARLPHAIASILTVALIWKGRRYLGRLGALIAAGMILISPYMLYYGRYARNESFVALFGIGTLYAILRYLESGQKRHAILLTAVTALHFVTKETAFIYTAQALLFLAFYLINRITRLRWARPPFLKAFLLALAIGLLLAGAPLGMAIYNRFRFATDAAQTAAPVVPGETPAEAGSALLTCLPKAATAAILASLIAFLLAVLFLIVGYGWKNLRRERAFDMILLLGTFVLPQLTPLAVKALGWDPLAYQFTWPGWDLAAIFAQAPAKTALVLAGMFALSVVIGLLWDWKQWLIHASIFWGIYTLFYTSLFTNWAGMATGLVGSLGYWLEQQSVHRGDQPWYYYFLLQIPFYEFLPALGVALAAFFGFRRKTPALPGNSSPVQDTEPHERNATEKLVFPLLFWWSLSSLTAFTIAGEKMPWLTVHITLPMILLTGWGLGQAAERLRWENFGSGRGRLIVPAWLALFLSLSMLLACLLGNHPPFQGKTLQQLSATGSFLFALLLALGSGGGLYLLCRHRPLKDTLRLAVLIFFALLAILTGRTAVRAAFLHPNEAGEFLVYAHGAGGVKDAMMQVEKISKRIAGEHNLVVAYDNSGDTQGVAWPLRWYLRAYPNAKPFIQPDSAILDAPVILVDPQNYNSAEALLGETYYRLEFLRMVWPMQDYFGLTWPRLARAVSDRAWRSALFQIWLNADYTQYAALSGKTTLTPAAWRPADPFAVYIRKQEAAKIWEYPIFPSVVFKPDPYEAGRIPLQADLIIGEPGNGKGQFNHPHGLVVAPDNTVYVADTNNGRIQHFSAEGEYLNQLGFSLGVFTGTAPLGSLNQPWSVAVSPDGRWIYAADTWNHRIVKFSRDGAPIQTWGQGTYDPSTTEPFVLWGPRGIAVDALGRVFVADTGNKRIVVYDEEGNFVLQIGNGGSGIGQFEEPVGLAFDQQGNLYVADTWNQRIQVFAPSADASSYFPSLQWEVYGWEEESLERPYLAVDSAGHLFVTDPEGCRVLEFTTTGEFLRTWGTCGIGIENFGLASAVSVDGEGRVWVSDAANNRLMRFTLP